MFNHSIAEGRTHRPDAEKNALRCIILCEKSRAEHSLFLLNLAREASPTRFCTRQDFLTLSEPAHHRHFEARQSNAEIFLSPSPNFSLTSLRQHRQDAFRKYHQYWFSPDHQTTKRDFVESLQDASVGTLKRKLLTRGLNRPSWSRTLRTSRKSRHVSY